ncbi:hypothetical protein ROZALSC1DRAFT_21741 [Rozella allomycis CSF55]|uniref:DUF6818 domain-containing protein n=1 Tax=Rozella allomycis (strain CSF55) TaxID=988480 RepID=A0A4P9YKB8_ROZAC|nr:hypothetical protein ROZALSC1DRAFT_21741 [Rozella allomycis CSF55]
MKMIYSDQWTCFENRANGFANFFCERRKSIANFDPNLISQIFAKSNLRAHPGNKHKMTRGKGWKDSETKRMLDIVKEILPAGGFQWEEVTVKYNLRRPSGFADRELDAIKRKFNSLRNTPKPTGKELKANKVGDPDCPPHVREAKQIQRLIETTNAVAEEDDDRLEEPWEKAAANAITNSVISGDMIMPFDELLADNNKEKFDDPSFDFTQFEEDNNLSTQPESDTETNSILSTPSAKRVKKISTKLNLPYSHLRLGIDDLRKIKKIPGTKTNGNGIFKESEKGGKARS